MKLSMSNFWFIKMCREHGMSEPEYFQKFDCMVRRENALVPWAGWILTFKTEEGYTQFLLTYGEYVK